MPFSSTQVSGLIGGQQAMFSNQHSYAMQLAGMQGTSMSNPYPSYGTPDSPGVAGAGMAGTIGAGLPAAAGAGTMAASLLGYKSPLGMLDPFTGTMRAFGAGASGAGAAGRAGIMAGTQGMGFMAGMRGIGSAFAQGGIRGGIGAMGAGAAAAALPAAAYIAAGKAVSFAGEGIYQGAQDIQDVGRMTQQYMSPGAGGVGGGSPNLGVIKQVTSLLREMADKDVMRDMTDMRRLMDQAGSMGMLQGASSADEFKRKFKGLISATKSIAQVMGTSLEEAMPFVQKMNQMGLWTARDVMGTATEMRGMSSVERQSMMGSMQTGAQMSHAMGGRLAAGAHVGRTLFGQVGAGLRTGTLSEQDIMEFSGGVGGARGRQIMAGGVQQVVAGMGRTALGRMMMAGMGEIEDGRFTGKMDEELLEKFQRGEVSIGQLQSQGKKRIGNQELATSFFNREGQMSQAMGAQGGLDMLGQGVRQAMSRAGKSGAGPEIENRFIQLLTGANQRQADVLQKMIRDLPRIRAEREDKAMQAIEASFRENETRRNRSLEGLSDALGQVYEQAERPFRVMGENFAASLSEMGENLQAKITGRGRTMPRVGASEMMRMHSTGALSGAQSYEQLGFQNLGQNFMDPGVLGNTIMNLRRPGALGRIGAGALAGGAAGAAIGSVTGVGAIGLGFAGAVGGGVAGAMGFDPITAMGGGGRMGGLNMTGMEMASIAPRARSFMAAGVRARRGPAGTGEVDIGGGLSMNVEEAQQGARMALYRSREATVAKLFGGETTAKRAAQDKVNAGIRKVLNDPKHTSRLRRIKEDNPDQYAQELMKTVMAEDPSARTGIAELGRGRGSSGEVLLNAAAIGMRETGSQGGDFAVDFDRVAEDVAGIVTGSPEEIQEAQRELISEMVGATGAFGGLGSAIAAGAAVGGATGLALGGVMAIPGALLGAAVGGIGHMMSVDMSEGELKAALTSGEYNTNDIVNYLQGKSSKFSDYARRKGGAAGKLARILDDARADPAKRKFWTEKLTRQGAIRAAQGKGQIDQRLKGFAAGLSAVGDIEGVSASTEEKLESARQMIADQGLAGLSGLQGLGLGGGELKALRSGAGGALGAQAALYQDISDLGVMGEKEFGTLRRKRGGIDRLISTTMASLSGPDKEKFEKMLKGGIDSSELGEFRERLGKAADLTFGKGTRGGDPFMKMLTAYTEANTAFVSAVSKALGDDIEEGADKVASMPSPTK